MTFTVAILSILFILSFLPASKFLEFRETL
jgi:hypothetical protein